MDIQPQKHFLSITLPEGWVSSAPLFNTMISIKNLFSAKSSMALPAPEISGNSVELCLNSRASYHEGWKGATQNKLISNVLWAANLAPVTGSYRSINVTLPYGKYQYETSTHSLTNRKLRWSRAAAFVINVDRRNDFDAGVAYMFAILASVSLWNGIKSQLVSCPVQDSLYFGISDVHELNDKLAASSSDESLPDPKTDGNESFGSITANLMYTDKFSHKDVSLEDLSQILWAGYGCTPHITYNGRCGLTVPSWCAEYYLTENIFVMNQDGTYIYHNRNPNNDLTTRDHRIELIRQDDLRDKLRSTVRELPRAPCYIILCLDAKDIDKWYARLEAGFVGGNMLLQESAMGMGCWFTTELIGDERKSICNILGIEATKTPFAIISTGYI